MAVVCNISRAEEGLEQVIGQEAVPSRISSQAGWSAVESRKVLRIHCRGHSIRDGAPAEGIFAGQCVFGEAVERTGAGGRAWSLVACCRRPWRGVARNV